VSDSSGRVLVEPSGPVLTLRISNPERANALDDGILEQLEAVLEGPEIESSRVALLTGAGDRAFSAGVAIDPGGADEQIECLKRREASLARAAAAIERAPRPVIAVVNGAAMGGGLELAAACDWRIASPAARFAMPPGRLGVVYLARGLRRFVALIGTAHAQELFLTARVMRPEEALRIGLVNEVVPADRLWERAIEMALAVAELAPTAVAGMRATIHAMAAGESLEGVERLNERWREEAYGSHDLIEGLAAFAERRVPRFTGE
jgi:enoyl-CoA hydratase/carnithine racemase